MTSAPSSDNIEEHQCPIIMRVEQSSTRRRDSASGFSKFFSWRRMDSRKSGYSLAWSESPAYTSSGLAMGMAGQGATFGVAISVPPADEYLTHSVPLGGSCLRTLLNQMPLPICLRLRFVKPFSKSPAC